jgi:hypothetical protein
MEILTLTYGRLYNLGNYENEKIEVTISVDNGDVAAARIAAVAAVEAEHAQMLAERRGGAPVSSPVPASDKQRRYIATLQDQLGWHSEQLATYASEQGIDLVSMTTAQASKFIDGLKRLNSGELPF